MTRPAHDPENPPAWSACDATHPNPECTTCEALIAFAAGVPPLSRLHRSAIREILHGEGVRGVARRADVPYGLAVFRIAALRVDG